MTFDSLTYARRLKAAGFSEAQAEALADANRELLIPDLATKDDVAALRDELHAAERRLVIRMDAQAERLVTRMDAEAGRLEARIDAQGERLQSAMEALGLRLTVRLGVMIAGGIAVLGALQRMH